MKKQTKTTLPPQEAQPERNPRMSETFLDLNLNSYVPPITLPDGQYQLRIEADPELKTKDNSRWLSVRMSVPDQPNAQGIFHTLWLPNGGEFDNQTRGKIIKFCNAFGIPVTPEGGTSIIGWSGLTAWANIITKSDPEYGDKNVIKSFV